MSNYLFISDAAKEVKVESHVLRYWEEELHLPIKRNELGHRYYTEEDVERFKQIKNMKERGLQLKAIKMILKDGKLDVLSMEETGMDRTVKRNQAELGPETELLDMGMDEGAMYGTQSSIAEEEIPMSGDTEMGMSGQRLPQGKMSQPGSQGAGMPGQRSSQRRTSQLGNSEVEIMGQRGAQSRMSQHMGAEMGVQGQRTSQSRASQAGIQKMRNADAKLPRAEMPMKNHMESSVTGESEGLAINIISAKEKEPAIQESREDKSRRLQWLLQQLIKQTLQENNIELCREIRDSVVKELDYQFRMQEEREDARDRMMEERNEEHYRRMDELIRKKSRRLRKMKPDRERQEKEGKDKKSNKLEERDKDHWEASSLDKSAEGADEWEQWSWSTDENNPKDEEVNVQGGKRRRRKELNKKMQEINSQNNDLSQEQEPEIRKKKRRFF